MKIDVFWSGRAHLAESPIWSTADAAFYWVDIYAGQVWRHDGAAQAARYWQLDQDVGCIALRAGGGLLAALRDGVYALQLHEDGSHHASLVAAAPMGAACVSMTVAAIAKGASGSAAWPTDKPPLPTLAVWRA